MSTQTLNPRLSEDIGWLLRESKTPKLRSMLNFAEDEIFIPEGPFEGRRFRGDRQPFSRLWFSAVDSGLWNRFAALGPRQAGKTLQCLIIPALWHLFECQETVIIGLPHMDMAADKWREDLLPVIERSRYRDLLPRRGAGSRGGRVEAVQFLNGATLRFMSGGGSDKSRAGFTSRVVLVTEVDGMDESSRVSREADKITQIEGCTRAFGRRKRIYLECTVSVEQGRIWAEYAGGTESRIAIRCPRCRKYVSPERDHLVGFQDASSVLEARRDGHFICPECKRPWSEDERREANLKALLVHRGQKIRRGKVEGPVPETDTLGFRWSAVNNLFIEAGDLAADEWRSARADDEENAEREMLQFVWARPYRSPAFEALALDPQTLLSRQGPWRRGVIPEETRWLTMGVDLGKWLGHWVLIAWLPDSSGHVVDYGIFEVPSRELGVERALLAALRDFREIVLQGWPDHRGKLRVPDQVWIDAGFQGREESPVYVFVRESQERGKNDRFRAVLGRGESQMRRYAHPKRVNSAIRFVGEQYFMSLRKVDRILVVEANADYWKSWAYERLRVPTGRKERTPGAITLYESTRPQDHLTFVKHVTAEREVEEFVAGRGVVRRWERVRQANHYFDTLWNASAAGHFAGVRVISDRAVDRSRSRPQRFTMPDGRPFLATERR